MRRAQQQTITFPAYDTASQTGALKTGLLFVPSDVKITRDGAAGVDATNAPVEVVNMPGIYAWTPTVAEFNCGWPLALITKAGMRPQVIFGAMAMHPTASVVADAGNTASTFVTDLPSSVNDFYLCQGVRFTTGALAGQTREIAGYNGSTKAITLAIPLTSAPAATDRFELIDS
jgi:hypothetical protein